MSGPHIMILISHHPLRPKKNVTPRPFWWGSGGTVALMGSVNKKDGHRRAMIHDHKMFSWLQPPTCCVDVDFFPQRKNTLFGEYIPNPNRSVLQRFAGRQFDEDVQMWRTGFFSDPKE